MAPQHDVSSSIGLLILRVGFGGYMMTHGYGKLQQVLEGSFSDQFDPIGMGPQLSLVLAMLAEFFGALLVLVGFLTRLAALPVAFTMGVAAFVVHANDPWAMSGTGSSKEPALLFLCAFLALVFTGAGRYSVDAWWTSRRKS